MENNLSDRTPVLPVTEKNLEKPLKTEYLEIKQTKLKKSFFSSLLVVLLIVAAFFLGYFFNKQTLVTLENTNANQDQITENQEASATTSISPANQKVVTEFLFTTDPNKDVSHDFQAWLLSLDGEQKKLDLPDFSIAFKYPNSSKVFFLQNAPFPGTDFDGFISVKDLLSNETQKYELIKHPKPEVNESININSLNNIAPDGSMLVYNVFFSEPCPPVTFEPGFEGGFGPCEPSPEPNFPNGDYVYDFATQTNTSLGELAIVSKWDLENKKLYFVSMEYQKNGLKVMDLKTKQISTVNNAETFGYGASPLLKSNFIVKVEGQTGDVAGQTSSSILSLYNLTTKETKILDSGRWADIQPFISVSPDESKFLYVRSTLDSQHRAIYSLHYYDFKTGQIKRATPESTISSYSIHGWWLDENNFVTTVNETGSSYDNSKNFLVKIDVTNQQLTKLTDGNVYRFNQN